MISENKIKSIESDTLSRYKTKHFFKYYGEITDPLDYINYVQWAKENSKKIYFLGQGSNTLFSKKNIDTLIIKNKIPKKINVLSKENNLVEISSTVLMHEILKYCYKNSWDSFYYLASVPATIGGALAMNAGEGKQKKSSIFDFVESVTYIDEDNVIKTISVNNMQINYRETMFTGIQGKFIIKALFKFPPRDYEGINPIKERVLWAKENQDNIAPNCGSVFCSSFSPIMRFMKGIKIGKATYSSKTRNWINNKSESNKPILTLIYIAKGLHFILRKECKVEVIKVK